MPAEVTFIKDGGRRVGIGRVIYTTSYEIEPQYDPKERIDSFLRSNPDWHLVPEDKEKYGYTRNYNSE